MKIILLFVSLILLITSGCKRKDEGLFGESDSKQDAIANGAQITEYVSEKKDFKLLDGTKMQLDTAWTETSFSYHNGKRLVDNAYGYQFNVLAKNDSIENFTFSFSLLDTANRMFTNAGPDKNGLCHLCPLKLYDTMKIVLEQKDPDTSKGWINPIRTDTIIFKKVGVSN